MKEVKRLGDSDDAEKFRFQTRGRWEHIPHQNKWTDEKSVDKKHTLLTVISADKMEKATRWVTEDPIASRIFLKKHVMVEEHGRPWYEGGFSKLDKMQALVRSSQQRSVSRWPRGKEWEEGRQPKNKQGKISKRLCWNVCCYLWRM